MEENKNNKYENEVPLEELRARYLKKKIRIHTYQQTNQSSHTDTYQQTEKETQNTSYETIEVLKQYRHARNKLEFARDIILLLAVLIVSALTIFSFAVSTTEIGGETFYGKTQTMVGFVWTDDDSLKNQMKEAAKQISDMDFDSQDAFVALNAATKLFRLIILFIPSALVALQTLVNVLKALY